MNDENKVTNINDTDYFKGNKDNSRYDGYWYLDMLGSAIESSTHIPMVFFDKGCTLPNGEVIEEDICMFLPFDENYPDLDDPTTYDKICGIDDIERVMEDFYVSDGLSYYLTKEELDFLDSTFKRKFGSDWFSKNISLQDEINEGLGLSSNEIERQKEELYYKYYGNNSRTNDNLKAPWSKDDEEKMHELSFREWVNACLAYGSYDKLVADYLNKYNYSIGETTLELYNVPEKRALEIIEEQKERFKNAKVNKNVFTDEEGLSYNSIDWNESLQESKDDEIKKNFLDYCDGKEEIVKLDIKKPLYEGLQKNNFRAKPFNYSWKFNDEEEKVSAAVIVIPDGLKFRDGTTMDATIYAENENGEVIDFNSVDEAQEWIDKYGDNVRIHIKNGNEVHATPNKSSDDKHESFISEKLPIVKKMSKEEINKYNSTFKNRINSDDDFVVIKLNGEIVSSGEWDYIKDDWSELRDVSNFDGTKYTFKDNKGNVYTMKKIKESFGTKNKYKNKLLIESINSQVAGLLQELSELKSEYHYGHKKENDDEIVNEVEDLFSKFPNNSVIVQSHISRYSGWTSRGSYTNEIVKTNSYQFVDGKWYTKSTNKEVGDTRNEVEVSNREMSLKLLHNSTPFELPNDTRTYDLLKTKAVNSKRVWDSENKSHSEVTKAYNEALTEDTNNFTKVINKVESDLNNVYPLSYDGFMDTDNGFLSNGLWYRFVSKEIPGDNWMEIKDKYRKVIDDFWDKYGVPYAVFTTVSHGYGHTGVYIFANIEIKDSAIDKINMNEGYVKLDDGREGYYIVRDNNNKEFVRTTYEPEAEEVQSRHEGSWIEFVEVDKEHSTNESGYYGWSMSNNAVDAYDEGEKPKSKWTKELILDAVNDIIEDAEDDRFSFDISLLQKLSKDKLQELLLTYDGWHHTGKFYNKTDFFYVDDDKLAKLTNDKIKELLNRKEEKKVQEKRKAKVTYLTWSGTRAHPRSTEHTEVCEIDDNWAYTKNGRKKLDSKYVEYELVKENLDEEKHDNLNPILWDENNELKPEVRETLLKVVDNYKKLLDKDGIELDIKDVIIAGSNANYNYHNKSDIDLHLIVDFSKLGDKAELTQLLCNAYRRIFEYKYNPSIKGLEVEVYIEPSNEEEKDDAEILDEAKLFGGWFKKLTSGLPNDSIATISI